MERRRPSCCSVRSRNEKEKEVVVRTAREVPPIAADAGEEVTAGLLADRMRVHEKAAWMLRSMLA